MHIFKKMNSVTVGFVCSDRVSTCMANCSGAKRHVKKQKTKVSLDNRVLHYIINFKMAMSLSKS